MTETQPSLNFAICTMYTTIEVALAVGRLIVRYIGYTVLNSKIVVASHSTVRTGTRGAET